MPQEDPMVLMRRKKVWVTKLAYRYLTFEQAIHFDRLYNSKYVWDNRKVYHLSKELIYKYNVERKQWLTKRKR